MSLITATSTPLPLSLRLRWVAFAIASALTCAAGYAALLAWGRVDFARRWLVLSAGVLLGLLISLWRGLEHNHRPGEMRLLPGLGAGNSLTLLRGLLVAALAGFLLSPRPSGWGAWLPGLLFSLAALADLFDGYMARRHNHATLLGERLDMLVDGLGMLITAALLVQYGTVPGWYLLVGLARYLFVAGVWVRRRLGWRLVPLDDSAVRRPFAGAQMGFIAVALYPLFTPPGTRLMATFFALPFLLGFLRDWLAVCGAFLDPSVAVAQPAVWREALRGLPAALADGWARWGAGLALALRFAAALAAGISIFAHLEAFQALLASAGDGGVKLVLSIALGLQVAGAVAVASGVAGRGAAVALFLAVGLYQPYLPLKGPDVALLALSTAVLFLGTGAWSLWQPEKVLLQRRLGEAR
ncbi:MAG: CDP-alcohol phosphatidyltransferase family protein [Anaerolineales bacterium]|nr:CDP-alcohol phosphatidyltransferase family protein [Anaerolineales bacterium]